MDLITPLWHRVRNPSQGRPHLRSHGDSDGTLPYSLRTVHSYEPYPPTGFVPRTSPGSQHDLSHGSPLSRRSRRSYQAPQLGLCGWNPTPPGPSLQGTILGTTDAIHHLGSITTSFTPSVSAEGNPGSLLIADGNREAWGLHPTWNDLGTCTPLLLIRRACRTTFSSCPCPASLHVARSLTIRLQDRPSFLPHLPVMTVPLLSIKQTFNPLRRKFKSSPPYMRASLLPSPIAPRMPPPPLPTLKIQFKRLTKTFAVIRRRIFQSLPIGFRHLRNGSQHSGRR